jgi:hypothetical protein
MKIIKILFTTFFSLYIGIVPALSQGCSGCHHPECPAYIKPSDGHIPSPDEMQNVYLDTQAQRLREEKEYIKSQAIKKITELMAKLASSGFPAQIDIDKWYGHFDVSDKYFMKHDLELANEIDKELTQAGYAVKITVVRDSYYKDAWKMILVVNKPDILFETNIKGEIIKKP